jgi:hypothetical protein
LDLAVDCAVGFLAVDLRWSDCLRRTEEEREVILFKTCVQSKLRRNASRTATFKSALIGIGESAPIRDR